MALKMLKNNRGIALLLTLTVITVLIVATLEMNRRMRSTVYSVAATRDRITLSQMASSGIHVAEAILVTDKDSSNFDSLQEDWADPEKIGEFLRDISFEDGTLTVAISDELGKIQVNSLVTYPDGHNFNVAQENLWHRLLNDLLNQDDFGEDTGDDTGDDTDPPTIINSMKDWMDSGDDEATTGLNGAESDYYQDLDPPYTCRNGPFTRVDELLLVKGVTPKLYFGSEALPGISTLVTVFGSTQGQKNTVTYEGKININTADLPVLAAILPLGHQDLAGNIYDYREEKDGSVYIHDLSNITWYKNVPGLSDIQIDPDLITISSDIFRIESLAALHDMKMKITAVVQRETNKKTGKWECKALSWETE